MPNDEVEALAVSVVEADSSGKLRAALAAAGTEAKEVGLIDVGALSQLGLSVSELLLVKRHGWTLKMY